MSGSDRLPSVEWFEERIRILPGEPATKLES